ncbi:MAG TPA: hypothetical protein VGH23_07050 [Rhizomicrobium sp.]|jgi:hypothetical protein
MRTLEVGLALLLAVIAFVVFKLIGLVFKFALIAALAGLVVGFVIGRALRRSV